MRETPGLDPPRRSRVPILYPAYQTQLRWFGLTPSMSRKGPCDDNAPKEGFRGTLKNELVQHRCDETREQARQEITEYIEICYARQRRHSRHGNCSPAVFAQQ
ncbi:MAG: transposase [Nitrospirae bacterium]|nr:transposase [Nitrospirota bacterium]